MLKEIRYGISKLTDLLYLKKAYRTVLCAAYKIPFIQENYPLCYKENTVDFAKSFHGKVNLNMSKID